jgi:hypothetical protein
MARKLDLWLVFALLWLIAGRIAFEIYRDTLLGL